MPNLRKVIVIGIRGADRDALAEELDILIPGGNASLLGDDE